MTLNAANASILAGLANSTAFVIAAVPFSSMTVFSIITNLYLTPIISVFGVLFNVICLVVLFNPKLKGVTYKYLAYKTVGHLISLCMTALSPMANCSMCPISQTIPVLIYRIYFLRYLTNTLFTSSALVEMALAYDRLLIFKSKNKFFSRIAFRYFLAFAIAFSVSINLPFMFASVIELVPNTTNRYRLINSSFGNSSFYRLYLILSNLLQSLVTLLVLIGLNTLVIIEFNQYIRNRSRLKNVPKRQETRLNNVEESSLAWSVATNYNTQINSTNAATNVSRPKRKVSSEKRFTIMILVASCLYAFTRLLSLINTSSNQIHQLIGITSNPFNTHFSVIDFSMSNAYFGSNFFIYYIFNKSFRRRFKNIFSF
jgi:hypothetical protein